MKPKARKTADLEQLRQDFEKHATIFVCGFEGIKVQDDFLLRKQVRAGGGRYRVVQNRLAERAAKGTPFEAALTGLRGMTSLAFAGDDPLGLVKALVAYGKENPVFQFKSGVVEGRVLDVAGLNQLATLPGRDEIYAKLLFMINAPAQRLLSVINAPGRDLAVVVNQAVKEGKFSA
jgi:large subunit ribosomal protein L10